MRTIETPATSIFEQVKIELPTWLHEHALELMPMYLSEWDWWPELAARGYDAGCSRVAMRELNNPSSKPSAKAMRQPCTHIDVTFSAYMLDPLLAQAQARGVSAPRFLGLAVRCGLKSIEGTSLVRSDEPA